MRHWLPSHSRLLHFHSLFLTLISALYLTFHTSRNAMEHSTSLVVIVGPVCLQARQQWALNLCNIPQYFWKCLLGSVAAQIWGRNQQLGKCHANEITCRVNAPILNTVGSPFFFQLTQLSCLSLSINSWSVVTVPLSLPPPFFSFFFTFRTLQGEKWCYTAFILRGFIFIHEETFDLKEDILHLPEKVNGTEGISSAYDFDAPI